MPATTDKFYNLKIDIISNGRVCVETAAVRSVIDKDDSQYFDIYIYRLKKAFIFEKNFIRRIYDLSRDKAYTDMDKFIADFNHELSQSDEGVNGAAALAKKIQRSEEILQPLLSDIILMLFIARIDIDNEQLKEKVIFEYITSKLPQAKNLSLLYVQKYLNSITVEREDFYRHLPDMRGKNKDEANDFYQTVLKICLSDGRMHYAERLYLAEIVQFFRLHDIDLV